MNRPISFWAAIGTALALSLGGCSKDDSASASGTADKLSGSITIDGSSTVQPISEAVAEEFRKIQPNVRVPVGRSGTGGGFKKFVKGEIDICDASRPITAEEITLAKENGIEFIELPIAYDGLSVVVNPQATFVDALTVAELKKIWEPGSKVATWKDVRSNWPAEKISLFGPGHDSGTFDYFTEAIMGKKASIRSDFQASEDDNQLVAGAAGEKNSLAYFGLSYYEANKDKLRLVPIDNGNGPIAPSAVTVRDGSYAPLSRPLFLYVTKAAAERPEVKEFIKFYLSKQGRDLVSAVDYIALQDELYDLAWLRFDRALTGSLFNGEPQVGVSLADLMAKEQGH